MLMENITFQNPTTQKIYNLLLTGAQVSVLELSAMFKTPDPRGHIRFIRQRGVTVSDYWVKTEFSRYKRYFIP